VAAVLLQRQGFDPEDMGKVERSIEMREQIAAAGHFPAEAAPQRFGIKG
jgi:hypothetical protein